MAHPAVNLDDLNPEEQLQLLEDLWDRLSERPANIPLSDEQRAELDRRLDALDDEIRAGRSLGRPWSEVRGRLRSR
ncbi:MAG TPA: addiction module protein [Vicinamibacteria bacterium]|nr:addiction module protein [Vicinamibacteria bacterium]